MPSLGWIVSWFGDVYSILPPPYGALLVPLASIVCGAIVGYERGRREKPAGVRTMILVCLGAAIFTQAGILMMHDPSPSRVAAQVVTGVGFLGAGTIMRDRTAVIGVTTAAAIWTVAAIGVTLGCGYVAAGVGFSVLTFMTLLGERFLETLVFGACRWTRVRIDFDDTDGKARPLIQEVLDEHGLPDADTKFEFTVGGAVSLSIRCCQYHRHHRDVLAALAALPVVSSIQTLDCESPVMA